MPITLISLIKKKKSQCYHATMVSPMTFINGNLFLSFVNSPESNIKDALGIDINTHPDLRCLYCQYKGQFSTRFVFCLLCLSLCSQAPSNAAA